MPRHGARAARSPTTAGWSAGRRGPTEGAQRIEDAGLEGVVGDPDRVGTVLEHVGDVAVVAWALGGAGGPTAVDVNGPRLERMLERLVDTPVRGFVLDAPAGSAGRRRTWSRGSGDAGASPRGSSRRTPAITSDWVAAMRDAVDRLIGG